MPWNPAIKFDVVFQPALPMRGVTYVRRKYYVHSVFQPALPMRGVTPFSKPAHPDTRISTRTPHAGSDPTERSNNVQYQHFNPHSPCGE